MKLAWGKGWIGPYEGQLSVLWKLAWANGWTWRQLKTRLNVSNEQLCLLTRAYAPLREDVEGIQHNERGRIKFEWNDLLCPDYGAGLSQLFSPVPQFCPTCTQMGYISYFHHFLPMIRCPIHHHPLRKVCSHCERTIASPALSQRLFDTPFFCWYCRHPLAGTFSWKSLYQTSAFHAHASAALAPLHQALEWIAKSDYGPDRSGAASFLPQLSVNDHDAATDQATKIFHALLDLAQATLDLSVFAPRPSCVRTVRYRRDQAIVKLDEDCLSTDADTLLRFKAVYKSLRRYLHKRVRQHHVACIKVVDAKLHVSFDKSTAWPQHDLCPVAQAFRIWRGRMRGDRLAATDFLTYEYKDRRRFRGDWSGWREHAMRHGDINLFAWQTLSSFHAVAATLVRYFEQVVQVKDSADPNNVLTPLTPFLQMDEPRFETESRDLSRASSDATGWRGLLVASEAAVGKLEKMSYRPSRRACVFHHAYQHSLRSARLIKAQERSRQLELFAAPIASAVNATQLELLTASQRA